MPGTPGAAGSSGSMATAWLAATTLTGSAGVVGSGEVPSPAFSSVAVVLIVVSVVASAQSCSPSVDPVAGSPASDSPLVDALFDFAMSRGM